MKGITFLLPCSNASDRGEDMATAIGTVIDGKYEILKQIGKGGMSVVYLAMDKHLNKQWAVKEIKKTANGKNEEIVVNSLITEANLMKKLDHPALPRIVDIIDNGQTLYVVMDYIEGESLDKVLEEYGAQPEDQVINWAIQICDALNYLHSQKPPIIYRDMKPANVMLKPDGNIKIIDFGIAREYKGTSLSDTTVLGTRGYASPEHYGTSETDARSDIYTLGMTMHHLLTGIDPRTPGYVYVPVRQWNPELSEGVEEIINKCTQIDPANRYQNCDELMYDLQHPDQIGKGIRNKKKKRLAFFTVAASLSVLFVILGTVFYFLMINANQNDYNLKIDETSATVDDCLDAMAIDGMGGRIDAYDRLVSICEEDQNISSATLKSLVNNINTNQAELSKDPGFSDLIYNIGFITFYYYEASAGEGVDNSVRVRAVSAGPYFDRYLNLSNIDENSDTYKLAQSYSRICNFYIQYVNNSVGSSLVKEPNADTFNEYLSAASDCIDFLDVYQNDETDASVKIEAYSVFADYINTYANAMAANGVNKNNVDDLLNKIIENATSLDNAVTPGGENDQRLQELLDFCENSYKSRVDRAYQNANSDKASS